MPYSDRFWWDGLTALRARLERQERATRPIRVAEKAAGIVCAGAGASALFALGPGIGAALGAMSPAVAGLFTTALLATTATALVLARLLVAED